MKFDIKNMNINPKKILKIGVAVVAGVAAVAGSIKDQNKEEEFEAMKKALSELQNK